jgi:hypothetical protein
VGGVPVGKNVGFNEGLPEIITGASEESGTDNVGLSVVGVATGAKVNVGLVTGLSIGGFVTGDTFDEVVGKNVGFNGEPTEAFGESEKDEDGSVALSVVGVATGARVDVRLSVTGDTVGAAFTGEADGLRDGSGVESVTVGAAVSNGCVTVEHNQ